MTEKLVCPRHLSSSVTRPLTHSLTQRLDELFANCLRYQEVRDEVFIAIMKQCDENEEKTAVPRAFELLAMLLKVGVRVVGDVGNLCADATVMWR